jgi:hypothetical protein
MIADYGTPFSAVVFTFPFDDFFNFKGLPIPASAGISGSLKVDYAKTASAQVRHPVAFFQNFFPGYFGGHTVKMYRNPRIPVGYGR